MFITKLRSCWLQNLNWQCYTSGFVNILYEMLTS